MVVRGSWCDSAHCIYLFCSLLKIAFPECLLYKTKSSHVAKIYPGLDQTPGSVGVAYCAVFRQQCQVSSLADLRIKAGKSSSVTKCCLRQSPRRHARKQDVVCCAWSRTQHKPGSRRGVRVCQPYPSGRRRWRLTETTQRLLAEKVKPSLTLDKYASKIWNLQGFVLE